VGDDRSGARLFLGNTPTWIEAGMQTSRPARY